MCPGPDRQGPGLGRQIRHVRQEPVDPVASRLGGPGQFAQAGGRGMADPARRLGNDRDPQQPGFAFDELDTLPFIDPQSGTDRRIFEPGADRRAVEGEGRRPGAGPSHRQPHAAVRVGR